MDSMSGGSKYFLVTTALEEFWDTSYPIVFLGERCKRYSRKFFWESIKADTLELQMNNQKTIEIFRYLNQLFERLLYPLTECMNQIHGVSFSTRFWRIVLGPWLLHYTHALYDRYLQIMSAKELYPNFTTLCLDEKCFVVPSNTSDFMEYIKSDLYNLQIYSKILKMFGYSFQTKKIETERQHYFNISSNESNNGLRNYLENLYVLLSRMFQNDRQVLFRNTYFPLYAQLKLMVKTKGKFWPCISKYEEIESFPINIKTRTFVGNVKFGDTEFERMLMPLIAFDMPQSMIEGFKIIRDKIQQNYVLRPRAIMSAVSWYYEDVFKIWAAVSAEHNTILIGTQHGGNYGSVAYHLQENHELSITDRYYSWGWNRKDCNSKVIPLSPSKLVEKNKMPFKKDIKEVLYVTATFPRYLIQYPLTSDYWKDYFSNQALFISHLSERLKRYLRIRPHREDFGWDVFERLKDLSFQIKIEYWNIPFSKSLANCRIYICDHPFYSTTFIESLKYSKPTILFCNPNFVANYTTLDATPYYNNLKKVGVLFDNPVDAARHLDSIYKDVENWWNNPERQEIINEFLNKFAKTESDWVKEWKMELDTIAVKF